MGQEGMTQRAYEIPGFMTWGTSISAIKDPVLIPLCLEGFIDWLPQRHQELHTLINVNHEEEWMVCFVYTGILWL